MKLLAAALAFAPHLPAPQQAPTADDDAPFATVDGVLDALYRSVSYGPGGECDWALMRSVLLEEVLFVQPPARGSTAPRILDLEGFVEDFRQFIRTSGTGKTGFEERITHRRTDVFGGIAHSYVVFEARTELGSAKPRSRGLDSIQLVRRDGRWWIASITTWFERPGSPLPARFLVDERR